MNRYVSIVTIVFAAGALVFMGAANGQHATTNTDTAGVIWKDASGTPLWESSAAAGSKVVKDADTGRLRPARAGELPETTGGRATEIIDLPDGSGIAIVGDDLMSESVAVKQADGSITVGHDAGARTQPEVK